MFWYIITSTIFANKQFRCVYKPFKKIDMYPILLSIGSYKLRANLVFFVLSCIGGIVFGIHEAKKRAEFRRLAAGLSVPVFLAGISFAYFVGRLNGGLYTLLTQTPSWQAFWQGGFVSFGAILGAFLYGFVLSKALRFPFLAAADLIAQIFPFMEAIYRIGCVLTGCCFGRVTDSFGGFYLPEVHGVWAVRYPTQLLLMGFNFLLFGLLWKCRTRLKASGNLSVLFLLLYSAGRFFIDGLRADMPMVGGLGFQQFTSLGLFGFTIIVVLFARYVWRKF